MTTDAAGRGMTPMDHDESCAYQRDWPRDLDPECERCRGLLAQEASDLAGRGRSVRPAMPGDPLASVPGYHHADDGTLCRTAARTSPADPVCTCAAPAGRGQAAPRVVWLWSDSDSNACWCGDCLNWIGDGETCPHLDVRRQVFGALARAEALAAGFDRWTEVTRWPFPKSDFASDHARKMTPDK